MGKVSYAILPNISTLAAFLIFLFGEDAFLPKVNKEQKDKKGSFEGCTKVALRMFKRFLEVSKLFMLSWLNTISGMDNRDARVILSTAKVIQTWHKVSTDQLK